MRLLCTIALATNGMVALGGGDECRLLGSWHHKHQAMPLPGKAIPFSNLHKGPALISGVLDSIIFYSFSAYDTITKGREQYRPCLHANTHRKSGRTYQSCLQLPAIHSSPFGVHKGCAAMAAVLCMQLAPCSHSPRCQTILAPTPPVSYGQEECPFPIRPPVFPFCHP